MIKRHKIILITLPILILIIGVTLFLVLRTNQQEQPFPSRISAGVNHSVAICDNGILWAWGRNWDGELGDGTFAPRHTPVKIMENVRFVDAHGALTMAITTDGTLWGWGHDWRGLFNSLSEDLEHQPMPVKIMENIANVSVGTAHVLAITNDGVLWAWGENWTGQLGDGTVETRTEPVKIMDNIAFAAAGDNHSAAIDINGVLWTWGANGFGQLGDGTDGVRLRPVQVMEDVALVRIGWARTMAITTEGVLWNWGITGAGFFDAHTRPIRIIDNVADVVAGVTFTLVLTTDGTLIGWGENLFSSLWNPEPIQATLSTEIIALPIVILSDVVSVTAGYAHVLAVTSDGDLWTWGWNEHGQLGDGTTIDRFTPVQINIT